MEFEAPMDHKVGGKNPQGSHFPDFEINCNELIFTNLNILRIWEYARGIGKLHFHQSYSDFVTCLIEFFILE